MSQIRLPKEHALRLAVKVAPIYAEFFTKLKADGGRVPMEDRIARIRHYHGHYVKLYDDERRIGAALAMALMGEQGFREFNEETKSFTHEEQIALLTEFAEYDELEELADTFVFPETEEEWQAAEKAHLELPPEERIELERRGALFFYGVFGNLFNTLSLMVQGRKLTTLVPLAMNADDDAFLMAVQMDRCLLTHHPYFIARKQKAQDEGEKEFLRALAYRESNPPLRGPIRYPGLFMLFGTLQSFNWLHELGHAEILDLCDEAGLDRYQNRIEDVGYVTKRIGDYYRWQKTGGVSMH